MKSLNIALVDICVFLLTLNYKLAYLFLISLIGLVPKNSRAQAFEKINTLPGSLHETSGLESLPNGWIISHNDSGDEPFIYILNGKGELIRKVFITGISHKDWEDISYDDKTDVLYIGDVGNNGNNRKDLEVGKIPFFLEHLSDTMSAESNVLVYSNQTEFPPVEARLHFDVEAMAHHEDFIYFFSKNRTAPYDGMLYLWRYPADFSSETASLVDSVFIGGIKTLNWITSADISHGRIALTSSMEAWIFDFKDSVTLQGNKQKFNYSHISQKEAIAWKSEDTVLVTDEDNGGGAGLYQLVFEESGLKGYSEPAFWEWRLGTLHWRSPKNLSHVSIYNIEGKVQWEKSISEKEFFLNTKGWSDGVYIVHVQYKDSSMESRKILYKDEL